MTSPEALTTCIHWSRVPSESEVWAGAFHPRVANTITMLGVEWQILLINGGACPSRRWRVISYRTFRLAEQPGTVQEPVTETTKALHVSALAQLVLSSSPVPINRGHSTLRTTATFNLCYRLSVAVLWQAIFWNFKKILVYGPTSCWSCACHWTRVRRFKPGRGWWISKGDKNAKHDFPRRGSKPVGPTK
jgi:hypothetical protein